VEAMTKPATWLILVISKINNFDYPKCNKDAIRAADRSWRKPLSIF